MSKEARRRLIHHGINPNTASEEEVERVEREIRRIRAENPEMVRVARLSIYSDGENHRVAVHAHA